MAEIPENWRRLAKEDPKRWATYIAHIDQTYAKATDDLNQMIDVLVQDMHERPEHLRDDDAQAMVALSIAMFHACRDNGGISFEMLTIYNAALYRLARQKIRAMVAS